MVEVLILRRFAKVPRKCDEEVLRENHKENHIDNKPRSK